MYSSSFVHSSLYVCTIIQKVAPEFLEQETNNYLDDLLQGFLSFL